MPLRGQRASHLIQERLINDESGYMLEPDKIFTFPDLLKD
jgi:hypothetical protein